MKNFSKSIAVLAVFMLLLSGCGQRSKTNKDSYKGRQEQSTPVQKQEIEKNTEILEGSVEEVLEEITETSEELIEADVSLDAELDELELFEF